MGCNGILCVRRTFILSLRCLIMMLLQYEHSLPTSLWTTVGYLVEKGGVVRPLHHLLHRKPCFSLRNKLHPASGI
jgi:hypothetical protein